jgi:hypothetical protein
MCAFHFIFITCDRNGLEKAGTTGKPKRLESRNDQISRNDSLHVSCRKYIYFYCHRKQASNFTLNKDKLHEIHLLYTSYKYDIQYSTVYGYMLTTKDATVLKIQKTKFTDVYNTL